MKKQHQILSVLFAAWIVSQLDRMAMSVALPYISADLHLTSVQSGLLLSAFFAGYSLCQIPGGLLADRFGVRKVASAALLWWSVFTALTGAATTLVHMSLTRFVFGLGEGMFPACSFKAIAMWFPQRKRATANATMLASNPLGTALSPLFVVAIMSVWGWRSVFFWLLVPGLIITLLFWNVLAAPVPNSDTEGSGLRGPSDPVVEPESTKPSIMEVLKQPYILRYFLILFTTDITIWGFVAWLPTFLIKAKGFSMVQMGVTASLPFFAGTVSSVISGWASDRYFRRDRRIPIMIAQILCAAFLYLSVTVSSSFALIFCQTAVGFAIFWFFGAFWALPMTSIPTRLMGISSGVINMAGQTAAFLSPLLLGAVVEASGGDFRPGFYFLVAMILISSAIVLTLPKSDDAELAD